MADQATQESTYELQAQQNQTANLAINAAIENDWKCAIDLNKKILNSNPQDLDAQNRLGRAYLETGNLDKAKKTYQKVLKIDPYNVIAQKNLKRLAKVKGNCKSHANNRPNGNHLFDNHVFLAEPGKTKLISLVKLTTPTVLSSLCCGDEVFLNPKKHSVSVFDVAGQYLGALPDDLSHQIISLLAGGNKYQAYVKKIASNALQVFIREVFRSKKFANQPSFWETCNINVIPSTRQESARLKDDFENPNLEEEI